MIRKLFIMRGIPGSGKSYEAKRICARAIAAGYSYVVCSADEFFMKPDGNGNLAYQFNGNEIGAAHEQCQSNAAQAIRENVEYIIIDNTNCTPYEAGFYVSEALSAKDGEYEVHFVEPDSPQWKEFQEYYKSVNGKVKENAPIIDKLAKLNTHGVPRQSIFKMMCRWVPEITIQSAVDAYLK